MSDKDDLTDQLVDGIALMASRVEDDEAAIVMDLNRRLEELADNESVQAMMRQFGREMVLRADPVLGAIGRKCLCGSNTARSFIVTRALVIWLTDMGNDGDPDVDPGPLPEARQEDQA